MSAARRFLVPDQPVGSLSDYRAAGGGAGLDQAHRLGPSAVVDEVRAAGLRGRGGGGFPTGVKWAGISRADGEEKYVVCNAAEGEPGTFKDRWLMRTNPYQLLEGIALACFAAGAGGAFIGVKARFTVEIAALERAAAEMGEAGMLAGVSLTIVPGPDDYLFGEEKALLEVIEGHDPLPRIHPPYIQGLFEDADGEARPVIVNNVETLSNIPHIVANGASWFRSFGTDSTPGTMVFTVGGDVVREAVVELEMGTPLSHLVYGVGGGLAGGHHPLLVTNGVSNRAVLASQLDTPLDFDSMRAIGSGLGSGGFTVYDETVCVAQLGAELSAFLNRGSCGQCPPCKLGTGEIALRLRQMAEGSAQQSALEEVAAWSMRVTDANRCGLGAGQRAVATGLLVDFPDHLVAHSLGQPCESDRVAHVPVIDDWDQEAGRFRYRSTA